MILQAASTAILEPGRDGGWCIQPNEAQLELMPPRMTSASPGSHGSLRLCRDCPRRDSVDFRPAVTSMKAGLIHSGFATRGTRVVSGGLKRPSWFRLSVAYGVARTRSRSTRQGVGEGIVDGDGHFQVAWPFTLLNVGDLADFVARWAGWFADAAQGQMHHPGRMPEGAPGEAGDAGKIRSQSAHCQGGRRL